MSQHIRRFSLGHVMQTNRSEHVWSKKTAFYIFMELNATHFPLNNLGNTRFGLCEK